MIAPYERTAMADAHGPLPCIVGLQWWTTSCHVDVAFLSEIAAAEAMITQRLACPIPKANAYVERPRALVSK